MPLVDRAQPDAPPWLSVGEVARKLCLHPDTIYGRLKAGTFPARTLRVGRLWRIHRGDVERIAPLVLEFGDLAAADLLDEEDQ